MTDQTDPPPFKPRPPASADPITDVLKRMFETTSEEPVPEDFLNLLSRLDDAGDAASSDQTKEGGS